MTALERGAPGYPPALLDLPDPPAALHLRAPATAARLAELVREPCVAIVGARRASEPAVAFTCRLAAGIAQAGVAVVSGLALGIDAAAHAGALDAAGRTVAVLGCGIDRDYPRANAPLAGRIGTSGAIVSEYEAGVEPAPWRFPARNRIVAALAQAVVVVEASGRSGALITARLALELGREVLVVPAAPWHGAAQGCHGLLRDGAQPVIDAGDVLAALGIDPGAGRRQDPVLDAATARTLAAVRRAPATLEALALRLGDPPGRLQAALGVLELEGLIVIERDGTVTAP